MVEGIKRNPVNSSNIASVGHDEESKTLEVEFRSGQVWQYSPVTRNGYNDLISAHTIGGYFAKHIKNNETLNAVQINT